MLRYLNRNIGYDPTEQRGVELSRLNRKEWGVDLCAVNELHLRNWVMEIFSIGLIFVWQVKLMTVRERVMHFFLQKASLTSHK